MSENMDINKRAQLEAFTLLPSGHNLRESREMLATAFIRGYEYNDFNHVRSLEQLQAKIDLAVEGLKEIFEGKGMSFDDCSCPEMARETLNKLGV